MLCQLSYKGVPPAQDRGDCLRQSLVVGIAGFEPATPRSRSECATKLRHTPRGRVPLYCDRPPPRGYLVGHVVPQHWGLEPQPPSRNEGTRTPGLTVPNRASYQLLHIPFAVTPDPLAGTPVSVGELNPRITLFPDQDSNLGRTA